MEAGGAASLFPDHSAFLIDCSRWYLARIVEEFNARGVLPTAEEVKKEAQKRCESSVIDFYLGFGRSVERILESHTKLGYYERVENENGKTTYRVLSAALQVAASWEIDERYWKEFRFKVC